MTEPNISVNIGQIRMENPVMNGAGTSGYGAEYTDLMNILGAFVTKSITLKPRKGNRVPRALDLNMGCMLNAIGLQNVGLEALIKEKLPYLRQFKVPVIVSIAGDTVEDYIEIAKRLNAKEEIVGLEVNISCPNVKKGGATFGTDPKIAYEVVKGVCEEATELTVITKLSPNVTDITEIARSVVKAGTNAISLINTITGMVIDIHTKKPILADTTGGLSGPVIKPIGVRMVWECYKYVCKDANIPIVGMGGISNSEDAIEYILAGATAIAVGTTNFYNPDVTKKIIQGIKKYLQKEDIADVKKLVGSLRT
jgi:dihydroorotate dehydrogenase (NAD+) catalytic subunit